MRKERYSHLNAEFQRISERDKKAFLSVRCKEIEEKNRMGKTESSSRKLESKGTYHAKIATIKDKNGMLTEAEDVKKRWQKYTKELFKKIFMTEITMMM